MKYDVFVQDNFYKTIENNNIAKIIEIIGNDIKNGAVSGFNNSKNQNITIVKSKEQPNEQPETYVPGAKIIGEDGSVQKLEN